MRKLVFAVLCALGLFAVAPEAKADIFLRDAFGNVVSVIPEVNGLTVGNFGLTPFVNTTIIRDGFGRRVEIVNDRFVGRREVFVGGRRAFVRFRRF